MCQHLSCMEPRGEFTLRFTISLLLLGLSCVLTFWSKAELRDTRGQQSEHVERPPLYLPEANTVRLVTLGFNNFFSDILWFNTVNYFGKQYLGSKDYRWLNEMCGLVTSLNPNALHVYEFCGTLLSWIGKEPEQSNALLSKAIEHHPTQWRYHYLRGFNYWYFLEQPEKARDDFEAAAKLPDAPPFLGSLASRLMVRTENPSTAVAFLNDLINNSTNQAARDALTEKLKRAILSRDIWSLEQAVEKFKSSKGRNPINLAELVVENYVATLPTEPFGGSYSLDPTTGKVVTSSGEKGLEFKGKTAKTGLFKNEFTAAEEAPKASNE